MDRDVQGGGRLVADEDVRLGGQSDRDDDALAHAAGEFEGVLLEAAFRLGDADFRHDGKGAFLGFAMGDADFAKVAAMLEDEFAIGFGESAFLEREKLFEDRLAEGAVAGNDVRFLRGDLLLRLGAGDG